MKTEYPFNPIYDENSKMLILGSFPSVKSREANFYYAHPQNRFWRIMARVCKQKPPVTVGQKRRFLLENNIALWDVIKSCDIEGSSDASICNVEVNDICDILKKTKIDAIYLNGKTTYKYFSKYVKNKINKEIKITVLPSTSSANATFTFDRLLYNWKKNIVIN